MSVMESGQFYNQTIKYKYQDNSRIQRKSRALIKFKVSFRVLLFFDLPFRQGNFFLRRYFPYLTDSEKAALNSLRKVTKDDKPNKQCT